MARLERVNVSKKSHKTFNFGVVGLGNISAIHAQAANALSGGRLYACFSRDSGKAARFSEAHKCRPYSDYKRFLADPDLHIVTIATPSGAHLEPAIAAARAKKHVVVEKPLEISPVRCRRIITACAKNRVKLATIFPTRLKDVGVAMKDAIDKKRIGTPVSGSAYVKWFRDQAYYDSGAWRGTRELDGGGALMNQGIHNVDMLIYLMGDAVEVFAFANRPTLKRIEVETNLVACLKFKNGALGVIEATTEAHPGYPKVLEINGSRGTLSSVEDELGHWDFEKELSRDKIIRQRLSANSGMSGGAADPMAISFDGHRRQFQELVDVLKGKKRKLTCDGSEGLRSVKLVCAIYESVRTGKPVKLR
jgi:UDP-N-acetyl-2-amino-2-deoxyglucuronate dehydrogenase